MRNEPYRKLSEKSKMNFLSRFIISLIIFASLPLSAEVKDPEIFTNKVLPVEGKPFSVVYKKANAAAGKVKFIVKDAKGKTISEAEKELTITDKTGKAELEITIPNNGMYSAVVIDAGKKYLLDIPVITSKRKVDFIYYAFNQATQDQDVRWVTMITSTGPNRKDLQERGVVCLSWFWGSNYMKEYKKQQVKKKKITADHKFSNEEITKVAKELYIKRYQEIKDKGYAGFGMDEFGGYVGRDGSTQAWMKGLIDARKEIPKDFIFAGWHAGPVSPELTGLYQVGLDVLLYESYMLNIVPNALGTELIEKDLEHRTARARGNDMFTAAGGPCKAIVTIGVQDAIDFKEQKKKSVIKSPPKIKRGKTVISLTGISIDKDKFFNIYQYNKPITAENVDLAQLIATKIPATQKVFKPESKKSGKFYYLITVADKWGQEERKFNSATMLGPFEEIDTTGPAAVTITNSFSNNKPVLSWDLPKMGNPEDIVKYSVYRSDSKDTLSNRNKLLKSIPINRSGKEMTFKDEKDIAPGKIYYYGVSALDSSSNESEISNIVKTGLFADLSINPQNLISRNKDISISKMYPIAGKKVKLSAKIHNRGAITAENVDIQVKAVDKNSNQVILLEKVISAIKPGTESVIAFEWKPGKVGKYNIDISIDAKNKLKEIDNKNNRAKLDVSVVEKDVYFLWYGDPLELKYANVPQTRFNIKEWKRRGAIPGSFGGVKGDQTKTYFKMPQDGFSAVLVDEIGGMHKDVKEFLNMLPKLKKKHPDFFIAVWLAAGISKELQKLVKDGVIDLLIIERYLKVGGGYEKAIRNDIKHARESGCIEKTIIGLGSSGNYANFEGPEAHADFLEKQIKLISEEAPEMPGVGFFTSDTLPGVKEKLDEMCYKYFIKKTTEPVEAK